VPSTTTFDQAYAAVADVEGWMTEGQARQLWDGAEGLERGQTVVEIGSYQGRSAIILATAAPEGVDVVAIDPHAGNDRGPQQIEGTADEGQGDHEAFVANIESAGVSDRIRHVRKPASAAGSDVGGSIDLLYIDGAHRYGPARDDIRDWGDRVADGGTMLIHDSFSSVGVTLALLRLLFWSSRFRYVGRSRSMAIYRREPVTRGDQVGNAARQLAELPWFARNVIIKTMIVAGLGRYTRLLGHQQGTWPY
jgi:SAM-dependent methyltransferase